MASYYTSTPNDPPVTPSQRASALAGLGATPDYGYGQNYADNVASRAGVNMAAYDIAAQKANDSYGSQQLQNERTAALSGLQQMTDSQKQQQDLANQRLQQMTGLASMLGGLYR